MRCWLSVCLSRSLSEESDCLDPGPRLEEERWRGEPLCLRQDWTPGVQKTCQIQQRYLYSAALQAAHVHKRFVTCYKSYLAVKLSTTFCAEVQPICLPDPSQDHDNQSALVTGWGRSGAKQEPIVSLKRLENREFKNIREYKISCYIFSCFFFKSDLVSVHSAEENDFVADLAGGQVVWLGGERECDDCTDFIWSDGTPWDFGIMIYYDNSWLYKQII